MLSELPAAARSMTIEHALQGIQRYLPVYGTETIEVAAACSRVLAEDVTAALPIPAHDSAALDGYAFRFLDASPDRPLRVIGHVTAGHPIEGKLAPSTAVRIFTGAVMPEGADTVAAQEECIVKDGMILPPAGLQPGANRRPAGNDVARSAVVLARGCKLRPQDVGMAVMVGRSELLVHRRIRAAVISTGDELRTPRTPLAAGCVYDVNRYAIVAALRALGVDVSDYGIVPDRRQAVEEALLLAVRANDLVITSGGMSVGEEDHVRSVVQDIGSLHFWKLALKPGKPVGVGEIGGVPFVGLPGNPVSAMIAFWLIVRPLALRRMGASDLSLPRYPAVATFHHRHTRGRREYLRVRTRSTSQGVLEAEPYHSTSSAMLSSLVWSDGLLEVPEDTGDVCKGDVLLYLPYHALSA